MSDTRREAHAKAELLMEAFPEDVDLKLTDELLHFHLYARQSHMPTEEHALSHTDLYQIKYKNNIQMVFPNVEAIMRLFPSSMITNCSGLREVFFKIHKN